MKEERERSIERLLKIPRVYHYDINFLGGNNCVAGLVDLCRKYVKPTDLAVEIGCLSGISSMAIALHCGTLHCVDSWEGLRNAEESFDKILPEYPNIRKVRMKSVEAAKLYGDESLDFVYIDADHAYGSVVQDITAWRGKVKAGGYIAGHDSYMADVLRAVRDCLGEPIEIFSDTSWITRK